MKKAANSITTEQPMPVEKIASGEFVRRISKDGSVQETTYVRGDFDRSSKRYSLTDFNDVNREVFVKKGTLLFVGFTY